MDLNGLADPFVKIRLMPDPNESPDLIRQTKYMSNTLEPDWQQTVVFMDVPKKELRRRWLDVSVWDYDRLKTNDFMGRCAVRLERRALDNKLHWFTLYTHEKDMPTPAQLAGGSNQQGGTSHASKENHSGRQMQKDSQHSRQGNSREAFDSSGGLNPVPKIQVIEDHSVQQRQQLQQQQQQQTQTGNSTTGNWTAGPDKQQWMLTRCDTVESKSSNSSSVNTDFLTEDQREVVRGWLGPGQLLLMNDELKTERGVAGEDLPAFNVKNASEEVIEVTKM
uniref:C2 domain-containing protein n=1 Tax=Macrostomum lignano TaxID=282301 RepID=A0A1I8HK32_9PLAT